jgi:putative Mn2+ efflux pump MntP
LTHSTLPLLVATAAAVGVLHTIVPDHWAPIAVIARQRGWSRRETARVAAGAGTGHALSTIVIGLFAFFAGAIAAERLGHEINVAAGIALVGFGIWSTVSALRELAVTVDPLPSPSVLPARTALMLILGSSPSIEVVPTFLAAAPFGIVGFLALSLAFSVTTIGTYVVTCVLSVAGLEQFRYAPLERYGEVVSGILVALIGFAFLIWFR